VKPIPVVLLAAILFALCGFGGPLRAASLRFLPMSEELAGRELGVRDAKGLTKLRNLNAQKRSDAYPCATGKQPVVLVAMDRESADGKPATVEIALPDGVKSPLVLILPDAVDPSGLRVLVVEDSAAGFPWGSLRFVNTTDFALSIRYEKESKPLAAAPAFADIVLGGEARNMGVQLSKEEDPEAVLYSAVWEFDPNVRKLILIVAGNDPAVAAVELKILPDSRPAKD
jgi:hypothetical protein